ncbi:uncharacterized protein [Panulirus ornatus]|uniref:uncharacterized protein n=1 Tax=Panulirus ornatus TaxID=150431 RepID=UPI003A84A8E2
MASGAGKQSIQYDFSKVLPLIITLQKHLDSVTTEQGSGWTLQPITPIKTKMCYAEEAEYMYNNPPTAEAVDEAIIKTKDLESQKEQLLNELQKINDQMAQEKAFCECQETEIKKAQDEVDEEVLCHQMQHLRASLFRANTLVSKVETFQANELFHVDREVKYLRAAQAKILKVMCHNITSLLEILQDRQLKESHLRCELWTLEDVGRLADHSIVMLEAMTSSYLKKSDELLKAYQVFLNFVEKALDNASNTGAEMGEVCHMFSNASHIQYHSINSSNPDNTLA